MRRPLALLCLIATVALVAAGCGKSAHDRPHNRIAEQRTVVLDQSATTPQAGQKLGFPGFATKNTTRVGGADPVADAAAVSQAVYPSAAAQTHPPAVVLVDRHDWRSALAASLLMSEPVRAPILYSDGKDLPRATQDALSALAPTGSKAAGGAKVIRVGDVPKPKGLSTTDIAGKGPYALAAAIARFTAAIGNQPSDAVVVVSADEPAYAMPAGAWAAKSGDPILFVTRAGIPAATRQALSNHPRIYLLGPPSVISPDIATQLGKLGKLTRIAGPDPVRNAIAFARYHDRTFGWGVDDPGHGLVFENPGRPLDAAAAAPLSASGTYGPALLVAKDGSLPDALQSYLLDIEPGYTNDPVRGVYNRGWVVGNADAVSLTAQARIDSVLEIARVKQPAGGAAP